MTFTDPLSYTHSGPSAGGLRRFARPPRPVPGTATGGAGGEGRPGESCELCGTSIGQEHSHMVDPQRRSIACACQACALLFTRPGGRYRTVPDRVRHDPLAPLTQAEWAELQIPVSIAFFFINSALDRALDRTPDGKNRHGIGHAAEPVPRGDDPPDPPQGRVIASYPSPAGVTECELDLAAWDRLAGAHPLLRALTPDVEAILVLGGGPHDATGTIETFLVPVDVCYSLAGALRRDWHGFDGGTEVKRILADLLATLNERSKALEV